MAFSYIRDLVSRLRVVYDKKSAQKAEQEVTTGFDRFAAAAKKVGAAIAAAFAVSKIVDFGKAAVREAIESDKVWAKLATTLGNAGVKFSEVERTIKLAATAMQDLTTVGDEEFAAALDRMITLTGDASGSFERMGLVADVAAQFFDGDLAPAADLVAKAMNGNTAALQRMGIEAKTSGEALEILADRSMGAAQARAKTMAGQLEILNNQWGEFKAAVGKAMIEAGDGVSVMDTLIGTLKTLTAWVETNSEAIVTFGKHLIHFAENAAKGAVFAFQEIADAAAILALGPLAAVTSALGGILKLFAYISAQAAKVPGVHSQSKIDAANLNKLADQLLRDAREELEAILSADPRKWFKGSGRAGGKKTPRDTTTPVDKPLPDGTGIMPGGGIGLPAEDPEEQASKTKTALDEVTDAAGEAESAWESAFDTIVDGFFEAGNAANGFAAGTAAALIDGVAAFAKVEAEKEVAAGLGKLAIGTWPPNPAALASAAKHFASATAWAALGGYASSRADATRGSGGSAGVSGSRASDVRPIDSKERITTEVHVYVDGVDPTNARHQDRIGEATAKYDQRKGTRIIMHPRGGRR